MKVKERVSKNERQRTSIRKFQIYIHIRNLNAERAIIISLT